VDSEVFEPDSDTFTTLGPLARLSKARFFHTATLLRDGKVLITGGCSAGHHAFSTKGFPRGSDRK